MNTALLSSLTTLTSAGIDGAEETAETAIMLAEMNEIDIVLDDAKSIATASNNLLHKIINNKITDDEAESEFREIVIRAISVVEQSPELGKSAVDVDASTDL